MARAVKVDSLKAAMGAVRTKMPNCIMLASVDMSAGTLLASSRSDLLLSSPSTTADLFEGPSVATLDRFFHGLIDEGSQAEILVFGERHLHIFQRGRQRPHHAFIYVFAGLSNVGMALAKARIAVVELEAAWGGA